MQLILFDFLISSLTVAPQLLGIPVESMACCDLKRESLQMVSANFPHLQHFHYNLQDQTAGASCSAHPGKFCRPAKVPDLAVIGSPCQPFSRQRVKRSVVGSVRGHSSFETTMSDLPTWLEAHQPRCAIAEQVHGLDVAESVQDPVTPLQRPGQFHDSFMTAVHSRY